MNAQNGEVLYITDLAEITNLTAMLLEHQDAEIAGRATYLRSLLAAVQIELSGKPVLRAPRPGRSTVKPEDALAALPEAMSPQDKQARTGFARSSTSTLRRAIALGWNPLTTSLAQISKVTLRRFIDEHKPPAPPSAKRAEKAVLRSVERIAQYLEGLDEDAAAGILEKALAALEGLGYVEPAKPAEPPPQRIQRHSITRHVPLPPQ